MDVLSAEDETTALSRIVGYWSPIDALAIPQKTGDDNDNDVLCYEGSSKSFRTFIFSRETVRAGGVVIGRVWECHVTSQSAKPADLAV